MENTEEISGVNITFKIEGLGEASGELKRHLAPRTIDLLVRTLPIEGRAAVYKEEIYFETPLKMGDEKAKNNIEKGTIAFWPMGSAICVFFGTSQPYSPVNVIGKITKNLKVFSKIKSGTKIKVEKSS